jgi:beta-carotene/zeaxanthin 4-ketolase
VVTSDTRSLPSQELISFKIDLDAIKGLLIAFTIIGLWASSITLLLSLNLSTINILWLVVAVLWQTFLYIGLFITAHDAMHGAVLPKNPRINHLIGSVAVMLYGLFSYKELLRKHGFHHRYPASELDPDYHDNQHKSFFGWYFYFMQRYWSWTRIIGYGLIFICLKYVLQIAILNLVLFWIIPAILSSVQLFYFGTFLTHQEPEEGYTSIHRAKSNDLSVFWSFITCYHFGYHEEHHAYPNVPWWKLPEVYHNSR